MRTEGSLVDRMSTKSVEYFSYSVLKGLPPRYLWVKRLYARE